MLTGNDCKKKQLSQMLAPSSYSPSSSSWSSLAVCVLGLVYNTAVRSGAVNAPADIWQKIFTVRPFDERFQILRLNTCSFQNRLKLLVSRVFEVAH